MTDNEKLALWQGLKQKPQYSIAEALHGIDFNIPDYVNNDSAAMSLLDTLVEKGFIWSLYGKPAGCLCKIYQSMTVKSVAMQESTTRCAAVVAAVLKLISKEP